MSRNKLVREPLIPIIESLWHINNNKTTKYKNGEIGIFVENSLEIPTNEKLEGKNVFLRLGLGGDGISIGGEASSAINFLLINSLEMGSKPGILKVNKNTDIDILGNFLGAGEVSTLEAGKDPTVDIVYDEELKMYKLNLGIPNAGSGATGPVGPTGISVYALYTSATSGTDDGLKWTGTNIQFGYKDSKGNTTTGDPFVIKNGTGISSITGTNKTGSNVANTVTVTKTDGSTNTFTVYNGAQGAAGSNGSNGAQGPMGPTGYVGNLSISGSSNGVIVSAKLDTSKNMILTKSNTLNLENIMFTGYTNDEIGVDHAREAFILANPGKWHSSGDGYSNNFNVKDFQYFGLQDLIIASSEAISTKGDLHRSVLSLCPCDGTFNMSTFLNGNLSEKKVIAENSISSDKHKKIDVTDKFNDSLIKLFDIMNIISFKWKDNIYKYLFSHGENSRYHTGIIAQELEENIRSVGLSGEDFSAIQSTFFAPSSKQYRSMQGGWQSPMVKINSDGKPIQYSYSENTYNWKHRNDGKNTKKYEIFNENIKFSLSRLEYEDYRKNIGYIMIEENSKLSTDQPPITIKSIFVETLDGILKEIPLSDSYIHFYYKNNDNDNIDYDTPLTYAEKNEAGETVINYYIDGTVDKMNKAVIIKFEEMFNLDEYESIIFNIDYISEYKIRLLPVTETAESYINANVQDRTNDSIIYDYKVDYDQLYNISMLSLQDLRQKYELEKESMLKDITYLKTELDSIKNMI